MTLMYDMGVAHGIGVERERIIQECGVGLVPIRRDGDRLAFAAPPRRRSGPLSDAELHRVTAGLGVDRADVVSHEWCDNGPGWQAVLLRSAEAVLAVRPDPVLLAGLDGVGPAGRGRLARPLAGSPREWRDRRGGPCHGLPERRPGSVAHRRRGAP